MVQVFCIFTDFFIIAKDLLRWGAEIFSCGTEFYLSCLWMSLLHVFWSFLIRCMCISGCFTCWRINHWSVGDSISHFCLCKHFLPDFLKEIFTGHRIMWYFYSFITLKMPFYHCLDTSNMGTLFYTLIGHFSRKLTIWLTHSKLPEFKLKACFLLCGKLCFLQAPWILPHVHSAGVLWRFEGSLWYRMETSPSVASSFPGFLL